MSKIEWCDRPVPEIRCRLRPGHDGLCCTSMEASLVAKCEDLRARLAEVERERDQAVSERNTQWDKRRAWESSALSAKARLAEVEAERDGWKKEARNYCVNADYWRERAAAIEAAWREEEEP